MSVIIIEQHEIIDSTKEKNQDIDMEMELDCDHQQNIRKYMIQN